MVPGKNETGMNTEMSTSEVAITAPVTSPMALEVAHVRIALAFRDVPLHIFDDDDGIVDH